MRKPFIAKLVFIAVLLGACFSLPSYSKENCDTTEAFKNYQKNNGWCDELLKNAPDFTGSCLTKISQNEVSSFAKSLLECGYHDEALPFLKQQRKNPYEGFNRAFWMEALLISDEDGLIREGLQQAPRGWYFSDAMRLYAYSYAYYGDLDTALEIMETAHEKNPVSSSIQETLSEIYLDAADFDKALYYADLLIERGYYLSSAYIVKSKVSFHRGNFEEALKYVLLAREAESASGPCSEAKIRLSLGEYETAYDLLSEFKNGFQYVGLIINNVFDIDFAKLYVELYEEQGNAINVNSLLATANRLVDEGDFYGASLHYYLLSVIQPDDKTHILNAARLLQNNGDMYEAVKMYRLYLTLVPDAEESDEITDFIYSRILPLNIPVLKCNQNIVSSDCERNNECYWNMEARRCYEKDSSCSYTYKSEEVCSAVPSKYGCYWNAGTETCDRSNKPCFLYSDRRACDNAPFNMNCEWSDAAGQCYQE